jgi:hypothetical protein
MEFAVRALRGWSVPLVLPIAQAWQVYAARQHYMDLKIKAVTAALQRDRDLYHNTGNAHHAWHAWQLVRQAGVSIPEWVAQFVDGIATRGVAERSRNTDTADRYEAALTAMEAAVKRHRMRLKIRKVGKQLGVDVPISRRDNPNLLAIARAVAKDHRVSVNRLLARYRSSH